MATLICGCWKTVEQIELIESKGAMKLQKDGIFTLIKCMNSLKLSGTRTLSDYFFDAPIWMFGVKLCLITDTGIDKKKERNQDVFLMNNDSTV